jgi:O-acetyl-ADP-ribose deacetylase (regulator of RNase III)
MTTWTASVGDVLDLEADALICSANPSLNLSGGVGGELLLRYGQSMQECLHEWLRKSDRQSLSPGMAVAVPGGAAPYRVVIHAVAIDAFYDSSAEIIAHAYRSALAEASRVGCKAIAAACLACGYGRVGPSVFAAGIRPHIRHAVPGVERIEFRSTDADIIRAVQSELALGDSEQSLAADSR